MKRWKRRKLSTAVWLATGIPTLAATSAAWAVDQYQADFNALYGTGTTALDSCLVCHTSTTGGARNSYGTDFETAKTGNTTDEVMTALGAIESLDSDGDGILNIAEINALTFPGDCADPDPAGCGGQPPEPPPGTITEGPTLQACYKWDQFSNERFALSIKRYGGLVTTEPRNDFIENQFQTNHGVHGKHVGPCGEGTIGLVDGTFLKQTEVGSHLGIQTIAGRGDGDLGGGDWCRSVVLDCVSEEDVQVPREFKCRSRNEFDLFHGKSQLKLVENPAE
ncbi:MAG: hypothetical protein U9P00_08380, partial [Pseudomonadota bacterium]|nr:hypothetical protein [Pseudomonadota bacterium]